MPSANLRKSTSVLLAYRPHFLRCFCWEHFCCCAGRLLPLPEVVGMPEPTRQKITFAEMRATGVRGLLIYCSDYRCSHSVAISGDRWSDDVRLSDIEPLFTCQTCGRKGADVRPNFGWEQEARRARLSGRHTSGLTKTVGSTSPSMAAVSVRMICGKNSDSGWKRPFDDTILC
jgi:hypothetical protein